MRIKVDIALYQSKSLFLDLLPPNNKILILLKGQSHEN